MGVSLEVWGVIGLSIGLFFLFLFEDHSDGDAEEEGYNLRKKCAVEVNKIGSLYKCVLDHLEKRIGLD